MGTTTPNIGIYIPAAGETNYDQSFAAGMVNIDQHDHSGGPNKGVPITGSGIADGAVTFEKLNADVADTASGIGTLTGLNANKLTILGLLKSIYQLGSDGIIVKTGAVASALTYATNLWTPEIAINASTVGITYTFQGGGYTQIGNIVAFWADVLLSSKGASVGDVTITNLPVTTSSSGGTQNIAVNLFNGVTLANYTSMSLQLSTSDTIANFVMAGQGQNSVNLTDAEISNTFQFLCSGTYLID